MIALGKNNVLRINRESDFGLYLSDDEGQEVLLPKKYTPTDFAIGQYLSVFVYLDHEERPTATTLVPAVTMGEWAYLRVAEVNAAGAFVDWGLEKQLLVPYAEQQVKMEAGKSYVVTLDLDEKTNRLFASNRVQRYLIPCLKQYDTNEPVRALVYKHLDLGFAAIVEGKYGGMLYRNEVFSNLEIGRFVKAYVKAVRPDGKLDLSLQPVGYTEAIGSQTEQVMRALFQADGFLPLHDKSEPDLIYQQLGMSKKAFKKAVGDLFKQRKITIGEDGIRMVAKGGK